MSNRFTVFDAGPQDMDWIRDLAVSASKTTFNGVRSTPAECARRIAERFSDLQRLSAQGLYKFLLARDTEQRNIPVGYLMLDLDEEDELGRTQTFIDDFVTLPSYQGLGVAHILYAAAVRVTAELGIDFMAAEFSVHNPFFETSLRNGCILESYRIIRPCTEQAHEKLEAAKQFRESEKLLTSKIRSLRERRQANRAKRQRPS